VGQAASVDAFAVSEGNARRNDVSRLARRGRNRRGSFDPDEARNADSRSEAGMIILGLETSGAVGSFAIRRDGRCIEECLLPELGRRHARSFVPEVIEFLARHRLKLADVDALAVSNGPGSFTGLRVGVTFAKMTAYALDVPLAAIETFAALAAQCDPASSVAVLADAQRRGVMFGRYVRGADGWYVRENDIELVARDELASRLCGVDLVTGAGIVGFGPADLNGARFASPSLIVPRAATIARLGEEQIARGGVADAWTLEPTYVRKSGAEEKRDAQRSAR
jgi:tRNA threonylcarbamoyladenosine biosynthesis protein TsaB